MEAAPDACATAAGTAGANAEHGYCCPKLLQMLQNHARALQTGKPHAVYLRILADLKRP